MRHLRKCARFVVKALHRLGTLSVLGKDQLERDPLPHAHVLGQIDLAHTAPTKDSLEAIATDDSVEHSLRCGKGAGLVRVTGTHGVSGEAALRMRSSDRAGKRKNTTAGQHSGRPKRSSTVEKLSTSAGSQSPFTRCPTR